MQNILRYTFFKNKSLHISLLHSQKGNSLHSVSSFNFSEAPGKPDKGPRRPRIFQARQTDAPKAETPVEKPGIFSKASEKVPLRPFIGKGATEATDQVEKISDKEKMMLFRIIQEQVNNVLKHSGARNLIIELLLEESENRIELNITDDGKGFNPEEVKGKKGLGLSNIMSRADLFGGKVTIMSAPGHGCKLRVQVPVI